MSVKCACCACGGVHICSYLSLILLEEHAGFRFLLKKRPSDCSYYWLLAKPKHRQVQKIWHELVWCQKISNPSKILARQHFFLLPVANQVLPLVALQKYWLKTLVYTYFGLP